MATRQESNDIVIAAVPWKENRAENLDLIYSPVLSLCSNRKSKRSSHGPHSIWRRLEVCRYQKKKNLSTSLPPHRFNRCLTTKNLHL